MRNIYSDEAGTSANEDVTIVVALIPHPDTQWRPVASEVKELVVKHVPEDHREGFAFHAKKLMKERNYPGWAMMDRYPLIHSMMELPQKFHIPLSFAAIKRDSAVKRGEIKGLRPFEIDHVYAFVLAVCWADKFLRQYCGEDVAQMIAENHPTMQRFLKQQLGLVRKAQPLTISTEKHRMHGQSAETVMEFNMVERIVDEVHFMDRTESPFLQIADACAYGIRRYFSFRHLDERATGYLERILGADFVEGMPAFTKVFWEHYSTIRVFDLNHPIY